MKIIKYMSLYILLINNNINISLFLLQNEINQNISYAFEKNTHSCKFHIIFIINKNNI